MLNLFLLKKMGYKSNFSANIDTIFINNNYIP